MTNISKSCWEQNASHWSENLSLDETRNLFGLPAFLNYVGNVQGKHILDVGCGEGAIARLLSDNEAASVTGIDLSEAMIAIAQSIELQSPKGINYIPSSFTNMTDSLGSQKFNLLLSYMVLGCSDSLDSFFKQSFLALKPGGILCFAVPHPCFQTKTSKWSKNNQGHLEGLLIKDYFDKSPYVRKWDFLANIVKHQEMKMEEYKIHWTLSDYINGLIKGGFHLLSINEPQPSLKAVRKQKRLDRWSRHAACFLFIKAVKR
ncbi:MAG: class I SAM-dependent methyltransferase [Alphaproteobacteria bacterium]